MVTVDVSLRGFALVFPILVRVDVDISRNMLPAFVVLCSIFLCFAIWETEVLIRIPLLFNMEILSIIQLRREACWCMFAKS